MKARSLRRFLVVPLILLALLAPASTAGATHSWGGYHWGRTANPFVVRLGDNVSSAWDSYLRAASSDWSQSTVLDTSVVAGQSWAASCSARSGRAEICNWTYGANGWLGLATVWANSTKHITQATVKMNDTYFTTAKYNTAAWRQLVMCQEVGHVFGLSHQDENYTNANLGTCMDYTNNPSTNLHPNSHDFAMLASIYNHRDATSTLAASTASTPSAAAAEEHRRDEWGRALRHDSEGRPILFERNLGAGERQFTWVIWAD